MRHLWSMRPILHALGLCALALLVVAQPAAADTQRQKVLPFIRVASDCIAGAVRRDFGFNDAVISDVFRPLINRAYSVCNDEIQRMVMAHNEIYGGGGELFLNVDYDADVERAVRTRLSGIIAETKAAQARETERRAAAEAEARANAAREAERQAAAEAEARANAAREAEQRAIADAQARAARVEAENRLRIASEEKLALAKKAQDLVRDKMFECIGNEAASMLLTNETAEVVAKAAMIFCRTNVDAMSAATLDVINMGPDATVSATAMRQQAETAVKDLVTAYVVKARGAMLAARQRQPVTPGQMPTATKNF